MKITNKFSIALGAATVLFCSCAATRSFAGQAEQFQDQIRLANMLINNPNTPPELRQEAENEKRMAEQDLANLRSLRQDSVESGPYAPSEPRGYDPNNSDISTSSGNRDTGERGYGADAR